MLININNRYVTKTYHYSEWWNVKIVTQKSRQECLCQLLWLWKLFWTIQLMQLDFKNGNLFKYWRNKNIFIYKTNDTCPENPRDTKLLELKIEFSKLGGIWKTYKVP